MTEAGASLSIDDLKQRLSDIPGIERLTMQVIGNRQMFSIGGKVIGVPIDASDADIEGIIRAGLNSTLTVAEIVKVPDAAPIPAPAAKAAVPAPGGFAAGIKAMLAEARAGVDQARVDGLSKVSEAVSKMNDAKAAIAHVTGSMSKAIADEADAVLAELGQISNMGPE